MDNSKKIIREQIITSRNALSTNEVIAKSHLICTKLLKHKKYLNSKFICCYMSINNEVDLKEFIIKAWEDGKTIAVPKVINNEMTFFIINSFDDLKEGYFHILEPITNEKMINPDLIITPGVAFTKSRDRLGYGGGFYDRFLNKYPTYTIGVGYNFQVIDTIKTNEYDIKLNEILTD